MFNKSANILYLFDFDGTLFGDSVWSGYFKNIISCLKKGPYIVPNSYDIRWCILSGRPKIDKIFIKLMCNWHGLFPRQIITAPTFTYQFKTFEDSIKFKEEFLKDILNEKTSMTYTPIKITKIFYIDNDQKVNSYLNERRENYVYIAITTIDFLNHSFDQLL